MLILILLSNSKFSEMFFWKNINEHSCLFIKNIIFKWSTFDLYNFTHFTHFTWIFTYIFRNFSTFKHSHIHIIQKIIFENRVFVKILHFIFENVNETISLLDINLKISKKRIYYSTKITWYMTQSFWYVLKIFDKIFDMC